MFSGKIFHHQLDLFIQENSLQINQAIDKCESWISSIKTKRIFSYSETQLEQDFNQLFFQQILSYSSRLKNHESYYFDSKFTTDVDSTSADAYLGFFGKENDVRVIIELKDAKTDLDKPQNRVNDKRSPVEQAFSYVPKFSGGSVKWVIVSNFVEFRLYNSNDISKYEKFIISDLSSPYQMGKLLFLIAFDRLT